MKKIIVLAAAAVISLSSFANVDPIRGVVLQAFRADFGNAKNVEWKSIEDTDLFQATFNYENSQLSAFYNAEGELVATARYVSQDNLPIMVTKKIRESYPEHVIKNVIEHIANNTTTYHVTLASPKSSMMVTATPSGQLSVFKKIKNKL
ncbi:hypothetical protein KJS94_13905 [Flavihumibacter rivuli]|uniref:hypothetical protein n=1 Tax=Flavihumibacter rivuli TaxID=2838156 RepID=UPI001BDF0F37|nr:hypothetical protein [Flavihumibacter rivuli]ULQ55738.1 hypothetical protein KJS94_13905 [Flavihumibacter rivuli]